MFYKNVDICDLESILTQGILSADAANNYNWTSGKRSDNPTDLVYLFSPKSHRNSFTNYGAALVACECSARQSEMTDLDVHRDDYTEYVCEAVLPREIKAVYVPAIFADRVKELLPSWVCDKLTFCDIRAEVYDDNGYVAASPEILEQFANTAPIWSTGSCNFFRGQFENREMIDLYNIEYDF